ncbi:ParB/Srx family N-terminal domain-containing protein [Aetokthonos hydrillicola Thurmond2011]|jgi:hypothetical protein|uniref:ParB/Srx family N-terminal domain-containing protein n=1 Tax=Aetokthonos hydrillicola Thurmond2011 TaxID=2712845 RepID=A0AAP5I6V3_9CYAN|nr:ParB/Srx family N-terminal domain-containing protein [Aetokthonos hydrillicola]MBO3461642.1 hypothetical protein [Aetokthonos hydrillicola CCALA 1050]MBW4588745.1 ParB/Srx family N-terminal domain-containing protein [Aetokthonos hydrillicola CCALA 1050]MDR9895921.1 ParB/Srx family N-terminal domain-containing protein [Aetokthonos hydrillicola Thurmond2011]
MKLSTSLVSVKKITCAAPLSMFQDEEVEQAAKLILESEGVINPIVVRRKDLQSYEVVDGAFEYYAALRAREIDPRKGETIGVFIIEPENEERLIKQVELFRKQKSDTSGKTVWNSDDIEMFLKNLESRFDKITHQLLEEATSKVRLENELENLKKKKPKNTKPLEIFNKLPKDQLASKLQNTGFSSKKASDIAEMVEIERLKEQFKSLNDVVERVKIPSGRKLVKGISPEKMLHIVDQWSDSN